MPQIIYNIPTEKLEEFKIGFLKSSPVPIDDETGLLEMTENEWLKEWGRRMFLQAYKNGKQKLAREELEIDINIVE